MNSMTNKHDIGTAPLAFDHQSGNFLERLIFNNRLIICLLFTVMTALFTAHAVRMEVNANFNKMLPASHPYIHNYLANQGELQGLGNAIRIVVENRNGDIYDPAFLDILRQITDDVGLLKGVDRLGIRSLWTPALRWTEITERGYSGGPVMPDRFDGSQQSMEDLRRNISVASLTGSFVGTDQRSAMVFVPVDDVDPVTGKALDYAAFSEQLETRIRQLESDGVRIHIVGFAKLMGDLIEGVVQIAFYFFVATLITGVAIFLYTRCIRSAVLVLFCSIVAVVWQLGIIRYLGYALDPFSVLVPFLVFAIGVSHGVQKMNGILQDVGMGASRYVAARFTFRRLFAAGVTALLADAVGFAVLTIIDIQAIRDLAVTASIGVAILVFTNLVLLPILLSYVGVSSKAAQRSLDAERTLHAAGEHSRFNVWETLASFTSRGRAQIILVIAAGLGIFGYLTSLQLQVGDLDPGAPELRQSSRYNLDNAYMSNWYSRSSDVFAVLVKSPEDGIGQPQTLIEMDRLEYKLNQLKVVQGTVSAAALSRLGTSAIFEGNPKWMSISQVPTLASQSVFDLKTNNPELMNPNGSVGAVIAYLTDHKAETLREVTELTEEFARTHSNHDRQFLLAAGTAGIEAATNASVGQANRIMLLMVYAAVSVLCLIAFRSWRATLVAVIPLMLTSILCEALMVYLGIGLKVATLPVVALGVGIGVDYALYLLSVQLHHQRNGLPLREAYRKALTFTGKMVALVGVTLAAGVLTWAWSPIKFQADMGILLTFMFVWNMIGALVLIPALSHFLLRNEGHAKTAPPVERVITKEQTA